MAAIHETAEGLHLIGLMNTATMREFDGACVSPVHPMSGREVQALRDQEGVSQAVFARYLNVTAALVDQWERGEQQPRGASLKLLSLVAKNGLDAII